LPELVLFQADRARLAELLKGLPRPPEVRRGTWAGIVRYQEVDTLELPELRALIAHYPDVVRVLGLPEKPELLVPTEASGSLRNRQETRECE
jgi:hypothetical protein